MAPGFFRPLVVRQAPGLNVSMPGAYPYEGGDRNPARSGPGDYAPRFDLREWEHYYELIGELPGADREDLSVFMADPHQLVVHGRVEHDLAGLFDPEVIEKKKKKKQHQHQQQQRDEPKPAQDEPESTTLDEPKPAALDEEEDDGVLVGDDEHDETSSNKSYQATVEDADDEDPNGAERGSQATSTAQPTPATTAAETESTKAAAEAESAPTPATAAAAAKTAVPRMPEYKPLVKERNFGSFWRTFRLPTLVDQDQISATLKDGCLRVTVQKAKRTEPRLIPIYA